MKNYVALVCLLLAVAVGCGQETSNSQPAPAAEQATQPSGAKPETPTAAKPPQAPAASSADAGEEIAAGEALETDEEEPVATRADTLLAAAVTQTPPEAPSRWKQGVNYKLLVPAQPTYASPEKVEVVYVFWYGCAHCYALDPYVQSWKEKKAPYIEFTRTPVTWGPAHRAHARLFYTLAALGKGEELHAAMFKEIQEKHNLLASNDPIETEEVQMQFAKRHGISEEEFRKHYSSFAVETNLQRAEQATKRYQVASVPLFVINGKYTTDVGMAGGQNQLMALVSDLAAQEAKKQ